MSINKILLRSFNELYNLFVGYALAQLVQAMRYKLEGSGFDSQ